MKYSKRLLQSKYTPEEIDSYQYLQKSSGIKTYSIYLIGGQTIRLKAYGYAYEVQAFSSLSGRWEEDKCIGQIAFRVPYQTKKGEKAKNTTQRYHYFKFDDVSAIVCEGFTEE